MKWIVPILGALVLILGATAHAQLKATGMATWEDTVVGTKYGAFGPNGTPTLCYQKDDGVWDFIVDGWEQIGKRQLWKSVRGNHRVYADSTGAGHYAVGNHHLGTKTVQVGKFNLSDSAWTPIWAGLTPESILVQGHAVAFYDIAPGVDKVLLNNAKVFREYTEQYHFRQEARDSLANYGPWSGYLLGLATRLNVDSLNLSLHDAAGAFGITEQGRITDRWVSAKSGDTVVFTMAASYLHTEDSATSIKVHKRIVLVGGSPYLVELFNPIQAASLPSGQLWHNATFGNTGEEGNDLNISNQIIGGNYDVPEDGTGDSIFAYVGQGHAQKTFLMKGAYYTISSGTYTLQDTTNEISVAYIPFGWATWKGMALQNSPSLNNGDQVSIIVWAEQLSGPLQMSVRFSDSGGSGTDSLDVKTSQTYGVWPDPITSVSVLYKEVSIYCVYTVPGGGVISARRRKLEGM